MCSFVSEGSNEDESMGGWLVGEGSIGDGSLKIVSAWQKMTRVQERELWAFREKFTGVWVIGPWRFGESDEGLQRLDQKRWCQACCFHLHYEYDTSTGCNRLLPAIAFKRFSNFDPIIMNSACLHRV